MTKTEKLKLTKQQQARWDNARRWAEKVNELLAAGAIVYMADDDYEDELEPMVVTETAIYSGKSPFCHYWFDLDPEYGDQLDLSVARFNREHKLKAYKPVEGKITW